jgi:hypothetical protein
VTATARIARTGKVPLRIWVMAARPRTLPAAIAPVLVGTALAGSEGTFRPLAFAAALVGSVFIQIGTNLSNDYSDARRGADTEDRLGPVRVTAGGLVPPRKVLVATWLAFGIAVAAGAYLITLVGWELLAIGAASILAGVLYTGGPRPYGYEGLGEAFVFLFFGIVAVVGSYYVQTEDLSALAFYLGVSVGLLAAAILLAAGAPGKRLALPNSRILIHQPSAGFEGQATDIDIHAREVLAVRDRIDQIYADHTGRPIEQVHDDMERDRFFKADEAADYGLIDRVIKSH